MEPGYNPHTVNMLSLENNSEVFFNFLGGEGRGVAKATSGQLL